jgi:hypothetical protein
MENEYRKLLNQIRETREQIKRDRESPQSQQLEQEAPVVEENPAAETTPKEPEKKEAVTDDTKEEQKFSLRKATVSKEHLGLKKWPPDELLDTAIEDVEFEETKIERISEMAGVVQIKLADAINNTPYENKGVKISNLEVENFRSDKRDFPFNFNYTVPNQGTHAVEGTIHVPTGKREKFEVTVNPENINLKKGLLPIPGLTWTQNKLLNAAGDKQLLARNLQTALQTSINHMLDTYYKNKIVDIQEENSA